MATITYERTARPTDISVGEEVDFTTGDAVEKDDEPSLEETLPTDLQTLADQARNANNHWLSSVLNGSSVSEIEAAVTSLTSGNAWCGAARAREQYGEEGIALANKILESDPAQRGDIIRRMLDTPRPKPKKIGEQVMRRISNHEFVARSEQSRKDSSRLSRFVLGLRR